MVIYARLNIEAPDDGEIFQNLSDLEAIFSGLQETDLKEIL